MTTQHSKLPPSSAARRMACPGSRALEEAHGMNDPTDASNEGNLAHTVAAMALNDKIDVSKDMAANFTDEMHEGAKYYLDTVKRFLSLHTVVVEEQVQCTSIHPDMWGTPDAWGIDEDMNLHVFDYKYGFTPVEAYENWQLLAYACGVYD
jgi:hypothetical protein